MLIRKVLLLFLGMSVAYALIVAVVTRWGHGAEDANPANSVKVERYLYDYQPTRPVTIVGTSLAAKLLMDSLPDFQNLALNGLSISDGLAIVGRSPQKPRIVLVEMNLYWKDSSAGFLSTLFDPVNYALKKSLVSLRSENQPVALAIEGVKRIVETSGRSHPLPALTSKQPTLPFQHRLFDYHKEEFARVPDSSQVARRLRELRITFNELQKQGIEIVFLEMPVHPEIGRIERVRFASQKFREAFPAGHYRYVPARKWNFKTTDGFHLTKEESLQFTRYLHSWYKASRDGI